MKPFPRIARVGGLILMNLALVEGGMRLIEISWRPHAPTAASSPFSPPSAESSPFRFGPQFGYEYRPNALMRHGPPEERANDRGIRGPNYASVKPKDTVRIALVGDSVVESLSVAFPDSWGQVLEKRLAEAGSGRRIEVLNAGVGGYVSWQALRRFQTHVLPYEPDLVLWHVGWNDLLFSSLPGWHPGYQLGELEKAYLKAPEEPSHSKALKTFLYEHSAAARLVRDLRNRIYNAQRVRSFLAERRSKASPTPFNEEGLRRYRENLEEGYRVGKRRGVPMVLLRWATLLTPELLNDPEVERRLLVLLEMSPLSVAEFYGWYRRYQDALGDFLAAHPDVVGIDLAEAFASLSGKERLGVFVDMAHFNEQGNRMFGTFVAERLLAQSLVRERLRLAAP